jgi:hypothetical protein
MANQILRGSFQFGSDIIECIIDGNNIMFMDVSTGMITTPEGLRIDRSGVYREFPDLKDDEQWKKKAIERLKEHIKTFDTNDKKLNYVKDELVKFGYVPLFRQRCGFRTDKKWN